MMRMIKNNGNIEITMKASEIIDRLTIVELKLKNTKSDDRKKTLQKEHDILNSTYNDIQQKNPEVATRLQSCKELLSKQNSILWNLEDDIRKIFAKSNIEIKDMAPELKIANKIYITNDCRCNIKNAISQLLNELNDPKLYKKKKTKFKKMKWKIF